MQEPQNTLTSKNNEFNPKVKVKKPPLKIEKNSKIISYQETHIGPIPSPRTLAMYDKIIPNGANRIMIMAENQSEHRQFLEKNITRSKNRQNLIGQIFAFITCIFSISAGAYCAINNHEISGTIIGVGGLTGLARVFIKGNEEKKEENEEKKEEK